MTAPTVASPIYCAPGDRPVARPCARVRALTFALGEAFQFDWGEESMVGGIPYRVQVAHVKLCASRAFWLVVYPNQGHESCSMPTPRRLPPSVRCRIAASMTT